jgi:hypothetical protein
MAAEPFNSAGGYTIGIPPISVIDSNGNITTSYANISGNLDVGENIVAVGNISATTFYGNLEGNVLADFIVDAPDTSVAFVKNGVVSGDANFTFNDTENTVTINGNLIANSLTMGSGEYEFSSTRMLFASTNSAGPDQVLQTISGTTHSAVEYMIIADDVTANARQTTKLLASILGTQISYLEFGTIDINGGVGDFKVQYTSGNIELTVSPLSPNPASYKIMVTSYK